MVGLVVAAHGRLAQELVATAEQIMGKLSAVTVSIEPGAGGEHPGTDAVRGEGTGPGGMGPGAGRPLRWHAVQESLLLCQKENVEVLAG
jgi:PTS system mannose-specific IIA component